MLKLTLTKKHTAGIGFHQRAGGAISRAMKEQHPEVKVMHEFDGFIRTEDKKHFDFSNSDIAGYSQISFDRLQSGEQKEIVIYLEENRIH